MSEEGKDNPDAQAKSLRPLRDAKMTEKGLKYQCDIKEREFRRCITTWRRSANKLRVTLSDTDDVQIIRQGRDDLQQVMDNAIAAQEALQNLMTSAELADDSLEKLDDLEQEHLELMKVVQEQIMDLGSSKSKKAKSSSQKS